MKKVSIMMSMLLALVLSSACSSDDDMSVLMNDRLKSFDDSTMVVPEYDYTGTLLYDSRYGWYIQYSCPIDRVDKYFPLNLPDGRRDSIIFRKSSQADRRGDGVS